LENSAKDVASILRPLKCSSNTENRKSGYKKLDPYINVDVVITEIGGTVGDIESHQNT